MEWEWREISQWIWIPGIAAILAGVWIEHRKGWQVSGETLRDLGVALSTAALISLAFFGATNEAEEERAEQAQKFEDMRADQAQVFEEEHALRVERSDNRRFVLSLSGPEHRLERLFTGFDLRGQNLNIAQLWGANFNEADLTEVTLYRAILSGVEFTDATLICASLRGADLRRADARHSPTFRRAKLQGADLRLLEFGDADLQDAEFGSVDGYDRSFPTNLSGANLEEVRNFGAAKFLSPVIYDEETRWPPGFPLPERAEPSDEYSYPSCMPDKYRLTEEA